MAKGQQESRTVSRRERFKKGEIDEEEQKRRDRMTIIYGVLLVVGVILVMVLLSQFLSGRG